MRSHLRTIAVLAAVVVASVVGLVAYSAYVQHEIYEESTSNIEGTCTQIERTFSLFADRNWSFLSDWKHDLSSMGGGADFEAEWRILGNVATLPVDSVGF